MVLLTNYHVQAQPEGRSRIPIPTRVPTPALSTCSSGAPVKGSRIPRPIAKAVKVVKKLPNYMRATVTSAVRAATRAAGVKGAQKAPSKKQKLPYTVKGSGVLKRQMGPAIAESVPPPPAQPVQGIAKLRRHVQSTLQPVKTFIRGPPSWAATEDNFTVDRRLLSGEKTRKDADRTIFMNKFISGLRLKKIYPLAYCNSPPSDWCYSRDVSSFGSSENRFFSGLPAPQYGAYAPPAEPEDDSLLDDIKFPALSQEELIHIKDKVFSVESLVEDTHPGKPIHGTSQVTDNITQAMENLTMEDLTMKNGHLGVVSLTRLSVMPSEVDLPKIRSLTSRVASGGICVSAVWNLI